jgi:hypothetical protein
MIITFDDASNRNKANENNITIVIASTGLSEVKNMNNASVITPKKTINSIKDVDTTEYISDFRIALRKLNIFFENKLENTLSFDFTLISLMLNKP